MRSPSCDITRPLLPASICLPEPLADERLDGRPFEQSVDDFSRLTVEQGSDARRPSELQRFRF